VIDTIACAAVRVARRGAHRCTYPDCADCHGAKLTAGRTTDHCEVHSWLDRKPRGFVEIDRMLFDALIPVVLGGESKPQQRRAARLAGR
jgi:hypothetical protein